MNRIISPLQLQQSVVKISYKKETATAFFIDRQKLVTAYHLFLDSVIDEDQIFIHLGDGSVQNCRILFKEEEADLCVLFCESADNVYIPLAGLSPRLNENWESYGFPYQ
ncbi:hypothetical protein, partial [Chryseobacterium sp.]|uniref:hypothetical protein n=1 Tax=Chryseobacterium sp. TaxID=1871047 RepID=UPI00289B3BB8